MKLNQILITNCDNPIVIMHFAIAYDSFLQEA